MGGISHKQLKKINSALNDAHQLFASMDGYPRIDITRYGPLISAGKPHLGIDPTYADLSITNVSAEISEVSIEEISSSGGAIEFSDKRLVTRTPVYNDDIVHICDVVGITKEKTNTGTGDLLSIITSASAPSTYWTISFSSSADFTVTNASGSQGAGSIGSKFTSTNSYLTILTTNWNGTFKSGDKLTIRTERSKYNVYKVEHSTTFGDYQCLVKKVS